MKRMWSKRRICNPTRRRFQHLVIVIFIVLSVFHARNNEAILLTRGKSQSLNNDVFSEDTIVLLNPQNVSVATSLSQGMARASVTTPSFNGAASNAATKEIKPKREMVWLMSFPNSGTSYTGANLVHLTNLSIASNYAKQRSNHSAATIPEWPSGPYSRYPQLPLPARYVLTKTHCGGYCDDCSPKDFVLSLSTFHRECQRTTFAELNSPVVTRYYDATPAKALHLLRDPFDNLVSRMHMAVNKRTRRPELGWTAKELEKFTTSRSGYTQWCLYLDQTPADPPELVDYAGLPCVSEWYRYVQWHNHCFALTRQQNMSTLILHYESYQQNETSWRLLDFLNASAIRTKPLTFRRQSYRSFYTQHELTLAERLVRTMASPETWKHVRGYFAGISNSSTKPPSG